MNKNLMVSAINLTIKEFQDLEEFFSNGNNESDVLQLTPFQILMLEHSAKIAIGKIAENKTRVIETSNNKDETEFAIDNANREIAHFQQFIEFVKK